MDAFERTWRALGVDPAAAWRVVGTVLVILVWLVLQRVVRRLLFRTISDPASRFSIGKLLNYLLGTIALLVVARLWIQGITGLATYLGLLSAGIAIALQDLITNFAGWVFIMIRRPFAIGDRIQIATFQGDVVDIRLFRFVMLEIGNWVHGDQSTGRVLHIPNGMVFKNPVANYDEAIGFIWNEIDVVVTFESDWRKAKRLLEEIAQQNAAAMEPEARKRVDAAAHEMHIQFSKLTPVVWTTAVDSGVRLTLRYLCKPRQRRSSTSAMWEKILDAFAPLPDVDLAYPTTRFFEHAAEGKTVTAEHDLGRPAARRSVAE